MAESLSQRLIGRLAAVLFMVSGGVSLASMSVPAAGRNVAALVSVSVAAMSVGAVTWTLPWHRWPRRATLPLALVAFALLGSGGFANLNLATFGIYFVVVFVWLGVAHPRWTALACAPVAAVAYLAPLVHHDVTGHELGSAVVVLPVCVLVGESLAWISARLRDAERLDLRRMSDMEALLNATVALARQDDAGAAADLTSDLAVRLLRASSAVVLLADGDGVLRGTGSSRWKGPVERLEARWLDQPARAALTTLDVTTHQGGVAGVLTRTTRGAPAVFLPISGQEGPLGLVMVSFPHGHGVELDGFTAGLARTFSTQVGLAFQRLHTTKVLIDASMRDALTGVGNRRQADTMLAALRPGDAVVLLDLDHFKDVNDHFGHAAGDEVLSQLARFLDRSLRDGDRIARFGGEEFVIVMRQAGAGALAAINRLAGGWRATGPVTTFSAGVAVHDQSGSPELTLGRADRALYEAKASGRDRAVLAGDAAPTASPATA